ncbi:hypothetical protein OV079_50150 [Nannocystis pusilla]|uniref:Uncharacterized protein n=2 Tax=Nannocystis pusilla TaxID=889268 RepID=A0A9X3F0L3_9BACT|nr:hypothetical protein [Nannocystis pusilla]MCY1013561.1 hypothetical protein [Nannocystis pusilla]
MIHIVHERGYCTEYVADLAERLPDRFALVRTPTSDATYEAPTLDPAVHRQLLFTRFNVHRTDDSRGVMWLAHSPGFGIYVFLDEFRVLASRGCQRLALYAPVLELIRRARLHDEESRQSRDLLLASVERGVVVPVTVDRMLNRIYNAPDSASRAAGTAVVAMNWRVGIHRESVERVSRVLDWLRRQGLSVTVLVHPVMLVDLPEFRRDFFEMLRLQGQRWVTLRRHELVGLFDSAEYVVTDGSGSCYEAIARGCKALLVDGLPYQQGTGALAPALEEGYLPPTRVEELARHPGADADFAWMRQWFARSLVREDVLDTLAGEAEAAFR